MTTAEAHVVVDSYGKQLHESKVDVSPSKFQTVLDMIEKHQISQEPETETAPKMIGGKIEYLQLFEDDTETFSGNTHGSGAQGDGALCGDITAVRQYLRSLFPDFQSLLK